MPPTRANLLRPTGLGRLRVRSWAVGLGAWALAFGAAPAGETAKPPRAAVELAGRPGLGLESAPVVVVEVSSFKCTHCRVFHEKIFPRLRERYIDTGQVQWVVVNASDDESEQHRKIFFLARCAHRQGKYWDILAELFGVAHRPPSFLEDLVSRSSRLDRSELEICLRDRSVRNEVAGDFAEAARLKVRGTPTFLLTKRGTDGQRTEATIAGAQTLEHFQRVLDALLKTP